MATTASMVDAVKKFVERATIPLTGEANFDPTLAILDHKADVIHVGILGELLASDDSLADLLTAFCLAHRAQAAVFTSPGWMAVMNKDELNVLPAEHPNRQEMALMLVVERGDDGGVATTMIMAPIIRENGKVGIGLWDEKAKGSHRPRFDRAMARGIDMAKIMPDDLKEWVDEQVANEAGTQRLFATIMSVITKVRSNINKGVGN